MTTDNERKRPLVNPFLVGYCLAKCDLRRAWWLRQQSEGAGGPRSIRARRARHTPSGCAKRPVSSSLKLRKRQAGRSVRKLNGELSSRSTSRTCSPAISGQTRLSSCSKCCRPSSIFSSCGPGRSWRSDKATREAIFGQILSLSLALDDEAGHAAKEAAYAAYRDHLDNAWKNPIPSPQPRPHRTPVRRQVGRSCLPPMRCGACSNEPTRKRTPGPRPRARRAPRRSHRGLLRCRGVPSAPRPASAGGLHPPLSAGPGSRDPDRPNGFTSSNGTATASSPGARTAWCTCGPAPGGIGPRTR